MKGHSNPQVPWVERFRLFSAALIQTVSIIEHVVIRIFKSGEHILFHVVIFGGVAYAVYRILIHH